MEQALLQAEKQTEQEKVEAENKIISELQLKLTQLDTATQKEKDKVGTKLWHVQCWTLPVSLFPECGLQVQCHYRFTRLDCLFMSRLPRDADSFFIQDLKKVSDQHVHHFSFQSFLTPNSPANLTLLFDPLTCLACSVKALRNGFE